MNFYMLIGIPGSGKSTWAEQNKAQLNFDICSSDEMRFRLFNDVGYQGNNQKVFQTLHNEIFKLLDNGKNICYDCTNVSRKDRKGILTTLRSRFHDDINIIGVCFITDVEICKNRNLARDRVVPEYVIDKMLLRFELPFMNEGFDEIQFIETDCKNKKHWLDAYDDMRDFDQKNPNHAYDLRTHCNKCQDYVLSKNSEYDIQPELSAAALFHDYGKLFTAQWDEIKQCNHYYGHENVGAYKFLLLDIPPILDKYKVAFYINYHMEPYKLNRAKESTMHRYERLFDTEWKNILLLHEGDVYAH